jgi:hypothetical protein
LIVLQVVSGKKANANPKEYALRVFWRELAKIKEYEMGEHQRRYGKGYVGSALGHEGRQEQGHGVSLGTSASTLRHYRRHGDNASGDVR